MPSSKIENNTYNIIQNYINLPNFSDKTHNYFEKYNNKLIIYEIYELLINNNFILKKFNFSNDNQSLYYINEIDKSALVKIIINNHTIQITVPLYKSKYLYTTEFNNLEKVFDYLAYHLNELNK